MLNTRMLKIVFMTANPIKAFVVRTLRMARLPQLTLDLATINSCRVGLSTNWDPTSLA